METSKIKILKFLTSFDIGGTERHVVNLLRGLDRSKFDVSMACLRRQGPFLKDIERLDIPVEEYSLGSFRSRRALQELFRCARWIRTNGVQIVHTYGFYSNVFGIPAAKLGGAPYAIASVRDTLEFPPVQSAVHKLVGRFADAIFVNADVIRRRLVAGGYNGAKIKVVKNGVDLSRFAPAARRTPLRSRLGWDDKFIVTYAGTHGMAHALDKVVDAAARLARRDDVRFLFVGEGAERRALEDKARSAGLDGVRFFGSVPRESMPEVYATADLCLVPLRKAELFTTVIPSKIFEIAAMERP
ncbi:MAG TPA: glycosyltransferase family 4 protein, partial [Candidatus Binatia bacterium]|nr:glycosyltransferase family 4 protein [Candidatus Binatia bacterium]